MNRIPLYEAIRRKKEAGGLNQTPQAQPVPQQEHRTEPRIQLKPSPTQAKQVPAQPKPLTKPVARPAVTLKGRVLKQPKQASRTMELVRELLNDKALLKWIAISIVAIVVVLLIINIARNSGESDLGVPGVPGSEGQAGLSKVETTDLDSQMSTGSGEPTGAESEVNQQVTVATPAPTRTQIPAAIQNEFQKPADEKPPVATKATATGDNVIVIVAYTKQGDLLPVQVYFKQNGIETEVIQRGSYFLLVTQNRYENPEKTGTDGYQIKQTIKRIGAKYRAPEGYERFGSTPFQDAYGMKIK
ncbi:MAG: hypothetical protein JXB18_06405 [Sedimentisphaerales bacterium]|nr:hypothetical protein [Sedimentisphaerales bacterium]